VHADAPGVENVPVVHAVHAVAPESENVPAGHGSGITGVVVSPVKL
jgi:hypothetical protein